MSENMLYILEPLNYVIKLKIIFFILKFKLKQRFDLSFQVFFRFAWNLMLVDGSITVFCKVHESTFIFRVL